MLNQFQRKYNGPVRKVPRNNWHEILNYLMPLHDLHKKLCIGCGKGFLEDKKGQKYSINRFMTVDEVKSIVEKIKKINEQVRDTSANTSE